MQEFKLELQNEHECPEDLAHEFAELANERGKDHAFKKLSLKRHPDKGGSSEAMAELRSALTLFEAQLAKQKEDERDREIAVRRAKTDAIADRVEKEMNDDIERVARNREENKRKAELIKERKAKAAAKKAAKLAAMAASESTVSDGVDETHVTTISVDDNVLDKDCNGAASNGESNDPARDEEGNVNVKAAVRRTAKTRKKKHDKSLEDDTVQNEKSDKKGDVTDKLVASAPKRKECGNIDIHSKKGAKVDRVSRKRRKMGVIEVATQGVGTGQNSRNPPINTLTETLANKVVGSDSFVEFECKDLVERAFSEYTKIRPGKPWAKTTLNRYKGKVRNSIVEDGKEDEKLPLKYIVAKAREMLKVAKETRTNDHNQALSAFNAFLKGIRILSKDMTM